jgi:Mg2+/citrate symporter
MCEPSLPSARLLRTQKAAAPLPKFLVNSILKVVVLGTVVAMGEKVLRQLFGAAGCVASIISHSEWRREHVDRALMVPSILRGGVFAGMMQGSEILKVMARPVVTVVSLTMAHKIPFDLGLTSMPLRAPAMSFTQATLRRPEDWLCTQPVGARALLHRRRDRPWQFEPPW